MQSLYQFLKTSVIGDLVVLVPVAVSVCIISAVINTVLSVLAPIAKELHVESVGGIAVVELAAILVVIAACFLFGLMIRTTVGQALGSWVEKHSSGEVTVFIPAAPAVSVGAVQGVNAKLVENLMCICARSLTALQSWGSALQR